MSWPGPGSSQEVQGIPELQNCGLQGPGDALEGNDHPSRHCHLLALVISLVSQDVVAAAVELAPERSW